MKLSRLLVGLIPILAPVLILFLIAKNGVNVPFFDEWSIPGQFLVLEKHTFADYFAQSNESRLIIPKAIFLAVSKFVGWQPKHYMYFGWLIVLLIFILIYKACYRRLTRGRNQDLTGLLCLSLSSALLFSPAAFENWLWGIQWVVFVPLLCAMIAFHIQDRTQSFTLRFCSSVFLNAVAMFSFANGMLMWIISFPFWREGTRWVGGSRASKSGTYRLLVWSLLYLLTAVIFARIYFIDYQQLPAHPSLTHALKEPWSVLRYFAAWCGGPFHSGVALRITLGMLFICLVLLVFLGIANRVRKHPGWRTVFFLRMSYPSLLIIAYAFASGMITAIGRVGFGVDQAFSSRYLFHSGVLLVGIIAAINAHRILTLRQRQSPGDCSGVFRNVIVVSLIFFLRTWHHYYQEFEARALAQKQTLLTVRMLAIAPKSPMVNKTCPWTDLSVLARALSDKNIYRTSSFGDWIADELTHPELENGGVFKIRKQSQSAISVAGWGMIPTQGTPAEAVLICRNGGSGHLEPWMMLAVGFKNDVVPEIPSKSLPKKCGFIEYFQSDWTVEVPSVEMFSVDERNRKLYPISRIP